MPDRKRPLRVLARVHPIWWLNAALVAAAAFVSATALGSARVENPHLPWYVLAVAVAACELWPVNLHFRRSAHAFSLTDVPATLGLIFATGPDFVAGLAVGTTVAMVLSRLPAIKVVFNLAQFVLANTIGFLSCA